MEDFALEIYIVNIRLGPGKNELDNALTRDNKQAVQALYLLGSKTSYHQIFNKILKSWDWLLWWSYRFDIWRASRQHSCFKGEDRINGDHWIYMPHWVGHHLSHQVLINFWTAFTNIVEL